MGRLLSGVIVLLTFLFTHTALYAQNSELRSHQSRFENLTGTHSISLDFGWKINNSTSAYATLTEVKTETNFSGSFGYQYWFNNEWSVNASVSVFHEESDVEFAGVSSSSIVPVLFGFSYYPEALSLGHAGRAHLGLKTGVYIGTHSESSGGFPDFGNIGTSNVRESVFGMEAHTGVDFIVFHWFEIGPSFSYHIVSDFEEQIGSRKNYSGPVFSFRMGFLF